MHNLFIFVIFKAFWILFILIVRIFQSIQQFDLEEIT